MNSTPTVSGGHSNLRLVRSVELPDQLPSELGHLYIETGVRSGMLPSRAQSDPYHCNLPFLSSKKFQVHVTFVQRWSGDSLMPMHLQLFGPCVGRMPAIRGAGP